MIQLLTVLELIFLSSQVAQTVERDSSLPPVKVMETLNQHFPGWEWSPIPTHLYCGESDTLQVKVQCGRWISGDYNEDGLADFAVKIMYGDSTKQDCVVALLAEQDQFAIHVLQKTYVNLDTYLAPIRKGAEGYNWGQGKEITYPRDAIEFIFQDKGDKKIIIESAPRMRAVQTKAVYPAA